MSCRSRSLSGHKLPVGFKRPSSRLTVSSVTLMPKLPYVCGHGHPPSPALAAGRGACDPKGGRGTHPGAKSRFAGPGQSPSRNFCEILQTPRQPDRGIQKAPDERGLGLSKLVLALKGTRGKGETPVR